MLMCVPAGICTWNYRVAGGNLGPARLQFDWLTEQGSMIVNGVELRVRKHGSMSGRWTLEQAGEIVAEAYKPSALFRAFELQGYGGQYTLRAISAFARGFELRSGASRVAIVEPVHLFTRRATVTAYEPVHEMVQLFAFWLVVMMWKRAADNDVAAT